MLKVAVITVSDRAYRGEYEDLSGPKIKQMIEESGIEAKVSLILVPDERKAITEGLVKNLDKDIILTTGGTGISPRDITPDVTRKVCDKEVPGISEYLRQESLKETKNAVFSRGFSGIKDKTIIINLPGSVKAVTLCTKLLVPVLEHGKKMFLGGRH
ncbi:MAG TPA: MogA/MoaB family molybdenum cofactor biosynthesis protein [Acidobacteriota bacterium]|nr:MogA/MoaB family molybdenum cofactor biosynthesis protein [Acidobacteriota bacterium]